MMWLIQLYKSRNNTTQSVYITEECEIENLENYINIDDYEHELSLCNAWNFREKKKLLILGKRQGTVLTTPKNERMIPYYFSYTGNQFRYGAFIIFEYKTELDFLMDFYVDTKIRGYATLPTDTTISSMEDLI